MIRRGKVRYAPVAPASEPADDGRAIPFPGDDLRKHMDVPEVASVRADRPKTGSIDGFIPLPRCSHCGTAVAHSQVVCHGCGRGLGRL